MEPPDPLYVLRGCASPVTSLLYYAPSSDVTAESATTRLLLSGTQKGRVYIWDLDTWRRVSLLEAHSDSVLSMHWSPSRSHVLLTQGRDSTVHQWDMATSAPTETATLQTPNPAFCPMACTTLAGVDVVILPAENQSHVDVVSMETKQTVLSLAPKDGASKRGICMHIKATTLPNQTTYILLGYEDGTVASWDPRMGMREIDCAKFHSETLMTFDYHAGVNRGLSASVDSTLVSWTLSPSGELTKQRQVEITGAGAGCVRFRDDGKLVAVGCWDGRIRVLTAKRQSPLVVLEQHKETVQCAAFSPGGMLTAGSKDRHISVWDIYT